MKTRRWNRSSKPSSVGHDASDGQQRGQAGAVVGNSGAVQAAVRVDGDFLVVAGREYGIEVRGEGNVGAFAVFHGVGDDVAGAVDACHRAERAELGQHPFGAALFEEGGRRDPAELQLLLGDPLFFAGKVLQSVANGGGVRKFGDLPGERGGIGREGRGFERSRQVLV